MVRTGRDGHRSDTTADAASVHVLFRSVNERIRDLNASFDSILPMGEWVCECADSSCIERLQMTFPEYEVVRDDPECFAVLPGHELPGERAVERRAGYVLVEGSAAADKRGARRDGRKAAGQERSPSR